MEERSFYLEISKIENEEMAFEFLKETGIPVTAEDVIGTYTCLDPENEIECLPSGNQISLRKLNVIYFCESSAYDILMTVLIIDNRMFILSDDWFKL